MIEESTRLGKGAGLGSLGVMETPLGWQLISWRESKTAEFKSWLCHFSAGWPWATGSSWSSHFLVHNTKITVNVGGMNAHIAQPMISSPEPHEMSLVTHFSLMKRWKHRKIMWPVSTFMYQTSHMERKTPRQKTGGAGVQPLTCCGNEMDWTQWLPDCTSHTLVQECRGGSVQGGKRKGSGLGFPL